MHLERGKPTAEIGLVLQTLADLGYDIALQKRQLSSVLQSQVTREDDEEKERMTPNNKD